MKKKQFLITLTVIALCLSGMLSVSGCKKENGSESQKYTVKLNSQQETVTVGKTVELTATVSPSDGANAVWTSGDEKMAKVTASGLKGTVTGVAEGETHIYCTVNGQFKDSCKVTVTKGVTDLSSSGTANCYIVPEKGQYKFKATVKGNSSESVGDAQKDSVLWESFGTNITPTVGDLVKNVTFADGYINFTATNKKGNAVIAVTDGSGNILWSWHIWLTDEPEKQEYNNSAGTMMDRNLGAYSAIPSDIGALGLLYQWGRKDPFLGSSSILSTMSTRAKSTGTWEKAVESTVETGTFIYAVQHPMQFIKSNSGNFDWYYSEEMSTDNTRWKPSDQEKGLYDPCPVGWRVPDGGNGGVWPVAFNTTSSWTTSSNWDANKRGMDFGKTDTKLVGIGDDQCWYPATSYLNRDNGSLSFAGYYGHYWSCTPVGINAYSLYFDRTGTVCPSLNYYRSYGYSVRCVLK